MNRKLRAFTLVELLVVIGIIAVLIAILVPSLGKAKQLAVSTSCLSNLRQCGIATVMYINDYNNQIPYPTTTLDTDIGDSAEHRLWFNAIDSYLASLDNTSRTGVAGSRAYTKYKQCPAVYSYLGNALNYGNVSGSQNTTSEYMRSYKMNSMLRHNAGGPASTNGYRQATLAQVTHPANFVLYGDGIGMDVVGNVPSQYDNGQFSMEVNDTGGNATPPCLRHLNGACVVFVDGHAEREELPLLNPPVNLSSLKIPIARWQSEYSDSAGKPYNPPTGSRSLPAGVGRNPAMPLQWSDFNNDLYR